MAGEPAHDSPYRPATRLIKALAKCNAAKSEASYTLDEERLDEARSRVHLGYRLTLSSSDIRSARGGCNLLSES